MEATGFIGKPRDSSEGIDAPLTSLAGWLPSKPEMSRPDRTIILDARAMSRALQRMAVEVLELAHGTDDLRSEEHTSELQSLAYLVCRLLLEKKKKKQMK